MGQVGETLRQARKEKGISLKEAEEATKINIKYLKALENEDYQIIPGRVYSLGFLRIYAQYLDLDVRETVSQYKMIAPEKELKMAVGATSRRASRTVLSEQRRPKYKNFIWVGLVTLLIAIIFSGFVYSRMMPDTNGNSDPEQKAVVNNGNPPITNPSASPVTGLETGVEVMVAVKTEHCWLGVTVDGEHAFSGTLAPGENKVFRGQKEVNIIFGNAGAVQVTQNGRDVGSIGLRGKVVSRLFGPLQ